MYQTQNSTCEINCTKDTCEICKAQGIEISEYRQIQVAIKRAQLDIAKQAYNDLEVLLQNARSNLCYALGEYERAVKKARESLT